MNLDQIIRRAEFVVDAIRPDGTVSGLWTTEEKVDLANEVYDLMHPALRLAHRHYFTRRMLSTDGSATILGQTYAPSSFALVVDTRLYTLPPDFIELERLSPLISAAADRTTLGVRFVHRDVGTPEFIERDVGGPPIQTSGHAGGYLYDLVGSRTLRISPAARRAMDLELLYVAQRPPLFRSTAGTVSVAASVVTGVGTTFADVLAPAEALLGTSGSATVPTPSLQRAYPVVSTIDSNTSITLTGPSPGTFAAGTGYILSAVPDIPLVHHRWLASLLAVMMLRKTSAQLADSMLQARFREWTQFVQPNLDAPRQTQDAIETPKYDPERW